LHWRFYSFALIFGSIHLDIFPLIAAEAYFFFLDKKETKNQDEKKLQPTGQTPGPLFRQAFARRVVNYRISQMIRVKTSAEKLRVKVDKTVDCVRG